MPSYERFLQVGLALEPIHVGAGGARIGRVDLPIVREPATRIPKIPGSSLAGVYRSYVAMHYEEERQNRKNNRQKPYFPDCAGLGQPKPDGTGGHCGQPNCPVCTVFGFARDQSGGFAGLASFSDAQVFLFPVPTYCGPYWVTCPASLRLVGLNVEDVKEDAVYLANSSLNKLNLGWLYLPVKTCSKYTEVQKKLEGLSVPSFITNRLAILPDHLFSCVVNSNLEIRTSVAINPETGAAEEKALFSYEALPRMTVLVWEIIAKNPRHFKIKDKEKTEDKELEVTLENGDKMNTPEKVHRVTQKAHPYLEHLGIGGMGTRGMGRLKVLYSGKCEGVGR